MAPNSPAAAAPIIPYVCVCVCVCVRACVRARTRVCVCLCDCACVREGEITVVTWSLGMQRDSEVGVIKLPSQAISGCTPGGEREREMEGKCEFCKNRMKDRRKEMKQRGIPGHPNHYFSPNAFRLWIISLRNAIILSLSLYLFIEGSAYQWAQNCTTALLHFFLWSRDSLSSLLFTLYLRDTRFSALCLNSHPFFFLNKYRESFCPFPYCFFSSPLSFLLSLLTSSNLSSLKR